MSISRPARTQDTIVKDFRTREILGATRRAIADIGYAAALMERIAQRAGVAKDILYLYFENKESLLVRTFEHGLGEPIAQARGATQRERGATCKLREIVRTGLERSALDEDVDTTVDFFLHGAGTGDNR